MLKTNPATVVCACIQTFEKLIDSGTVPLNVLLDDDEETP